MGDAPQHSADSFASIATAIVLAAVAVTAFNVQPIYLGAMADHLGFSAGQLGTIAGLEVAGSALAGITATFWIRRLNWRRAALFALTVIVLGNTASIYVSDFSALTILRFLTGYFGMGTAFALSLAAIGDTSKVERNFSITIVFQVAIAMLGFLVLPGYIETAGVSAVFLPLGGFALLLAPAIRFLPASSRKSVDSGVAAATKTSIAVWLALTCQCVWYLGLGGIWAFVERMGVAAGIGAESIGQALAVGLGLGILGAIAAALVSDRFGRAIPFTIAMLGQIFAIYLLSDLRGFSSLAIAIIVYNVTWNFALPYILAVAALADTGGRLVVLIATAQAAGITFGAMLGGAVIERFGLHAVLYQGAALALAALVIYLVLARQLEKPVA